jgi:peptide chain release factor 3
MSTPGPKQLKREVERRRTFAIISHPDAGKTTLTEKLLLYGGAIHLAGSVKARRAAKHAISDWMELEQQRGISITSSVLQFQYDKFAVNLLDTPGHADFSEDTYRTLAAADSAVMLLDVAKGVEPQTEKLFKVCRMRHLPIFTFVNKLDREGRNPLELMEEIENLLGIQAYPVNWPVGMGRAFVGVYDRQKKKVLRFVDTGAHGTEIVEVEELDIDDPIIRNKLGNQRYEQFVEEVELLEIAGEEFDLEKVRAGELTPMFFGSAMTNFGVEPFLDSFVRMAPSPADVKDPPRAPTEPEFAGFVFKIQANMNPAHRDRLAFVRVMSGKYEADMHAKLLRQDREIKLAYPQQFMADDRSKLEEAWPGDIIGLYDSGYFRIGDTVSNDDDAPFVDIPRFSPEHFAVVEIKDALRRKQLTKGLDQLAEEGAVQVFRQPYLGSKDAVIGAVGLLQFEVLKFRLENEYNVEVSLRTLNFKYARWVEGDFDQDAFDRADYTKVLLDQDDLPIILFRNDWALNYVKGNNPDMKLLANPPGTPGLEELHGAGWDF